MRIAFVCLGNICRSPTAEAVMRARLAEACLADRVTVESAGTGSWHIGEPSDARAVAEGRRRGVTMDGRARQFTASDFDRVDLVLAMDARNAADLRAIAPDRERAAKVRMLRDFDPRAVAGGDRDVPDPYFGEGDGFGRVYEMIDRACRGLVAHLRSEPAETA